MKRLAAILTSLCLMLTLIVGVIVSADTERKINRLIAFGDSIVFGDGRIQNPMNDQKCGDQQFANLIAQEYDLTYIKDKSDTATSGRWYRKYAHNGAIMKNESYRNSYYGSIMDQVTDCPASVIAAADTIVMDGGINDACRAAGTNFSNKGIPQGCTDDMFPQGVQTDFQNFTLDEMKTFINTMKNITEYDNSADTSIFSWQTIKKNIVDGYKEVMDTLLEKGFSGTIYMQNNINAFTEGKDGEENDKMVYYWDAAVDYFITDSIKQTIEAYPDVDIKLVDLCKELRHGTTYTGHGYSWDSPDNLHLSFAGNQAVYKYYSKFIDSDAETLDVGLDTIPKDASWRVLTTFDDSTQNIENGELVKIKDVIGVVSSGVVAEENLLKVNETTAVIDLSGYDLSNIYGIRVRFANAKDGGYSNVIFSTDNKQLYWNHGNSKSLDYVGVSSNEICGIKSSPYLTTIGRNPDFKKLENLTISSGISDDAIYVDDIEVFTNDTSLPTPELRTVISDESEVAFENFYMTYDPNTDGAIHAGSVGSASFCNHAMKYQGGNNNYLRLQTRSQLFTNPGGYTDLKIIWGSYPAYDLPSGKYKLIAFVVPSSTAGTFSFTHYENGNAYSSGGVLINNVDFSTATPIATYDDGAAKAYEIGEFTIVNGDTDKTLIKFDRVSDGAQLMLHGLAAIPVTEGEEQTTSTTEQTTATNSSATTTQTETTSTTQPTTTVSSDNEIVYNNFYMTYDPNTNNNHHVGSIGAPSFSNHAVQYDSSFSNNLFLANRSQLATNPDGSSDLKIIWGEHPAYDLTSGTYKLIAFVVSSSTAGTFSFTQYENGNVNGSNGVLVGNVDFTNATPIASYDGGKAKAYEVGEFTIVNGDTDKTAFKFAPVSDGAKLMLHGLAAVPVGSENPTTTTEPTTTEPTTAGPTMPTTSEATTVEQTTTTTTATTTTTTATTTTVEPTTTTTAEPITEQPTTAGPTTIVTTTSPVTSTDAPTTTATSTVTTTAEPTTTVAPTTTEPPFIYGDANGDNKVTATDVLLIRKNIAGQDIALNFKAADVNNDGKLTATDVLLIRKFIAGQNIELGK